MKILCQTLAVIGVITASTYAADAGDENPVTAAPRVSQSEVEAKAVDYNWTEIFHTLAGPILHTPKFTQFMFMSSGKGLNLNTKVLNGITLHEPLELKTRSTREEFIAAIKKAGIWKD